NTRLGQLVRRTEATPIGEVPAIPQPQGTRSVTISKSTDSPGNPSTLRNLTLQGNAGSIAIPPGTYGDFIANGKTGFVLGVPGGTAPVVYHFQHLTLNGQSRIHVAGPVIVRVQHGFTANGVSGLETHPEWFQLEIKQGGFTLNGGGTLYGHVLAPSGE